MVEHLLAKSVFVLPCADEALALEFIRKRIYGILVLDLYMVRWPTGSLTANVTATITKTSY